MIKTIKYFLILSFFCNYTYSQRITIKSIESKLITHQGVEFIGKLKEKNKDLYAFPNWNNQGVIYKADELAQLISSTNHQLMKRVSLMK